jgi:hypothetical protein
MQPDPSEISTQFSEPSTLHRPVTTSQHGFQSLALQPSSSSYERRGDLAESSSLAANATNNVLGSDKHTDAPLGRLNEFENHSRHPKAKVQRISEHENASTQAALTEQTDGPRFKVVKKDCNTLSGPQLENFPNGTSIFDHSNASPLISCRGSYSYSFPFASLIIVRSLTGLAPLLQSRYHTTCMAHCLL